MAFRITSSHQSHMPSAASSSVQAKVQKKINMFYAQDSICQKGKEVGFCKKLQNCCNWLLTPFWKFFAWIQSFFTQESQKESSITSLAITKSNRDGVIKSLEGDKKIYTLARIFLWINKSSEKELQILEDDSDLQDAIKNCALTILHKSSSKKINGFLATEPSILEDFLPWLQTLMDTLKKEKSIPAVIKKSLS